MPQGIDEAGVTAEDYIFIGTGHIDGGDADAVLDGTGTREDAPLKDVLLRPGSGREDEGRPCLRHSSPHFREIELIADGHPRLDAMELRLHERVPRRKELSFQVSLEEMALAVLRDALSIRRKEETSISNAFSMADRECARREHHAVRPGKGRKPFDEGIVTGKYMFIEMVEIVSDRPQFGEHEEIALFCCFFHQGKSTADISLHVSGSGCHLNHCDTHGILLKKSKAQSKKQKPTV